MFIFDWTDSGNSSDHQEQVLRLYPGDDAVFKWNIHVTGKVSFIHVLVEKNGKASDNHLLRCEWGNLSEISSSYKNRTNNVSCTANELGFTLLNISIQDAGRYIAKIPDTANSNSTNTTLFIYGEYI